MVRAGARRIRPGFPAFAIAFVLLLTVAAGCGEVDAGAGGAAFDVMERSITELAAALDAGEVTSRELVAGYLARIDAYDQRGPMLNAMVVLNPNAADEADRLDAERAAGQVRGPLHGIPVVVKDNYDTGDMPTSAGAIALATSVPPDDSTQVRRLREAGAIVLGKTNMHELARGITTVSSLTGQTRNPYDPTRNPGGSSGGTGAAVGASFGAVGMGSDTCGSIRIPSAHHALAGLRGTRGLASGDGIVPLSTTQDIGGPLARSVEDLAITLDATVGVDPADPVTARSEGRIPASFRDALDPDGLQGARLAVLHELLGDSGAERPVSTVIEAGAEAMEAAGAEIVDVGETDLRSLLEDASVIGLEFRRDFDAYLADTPDAPVRTLAELVEQGLYHEIIDNGLRSSLEVETLDTDDYRDRLARRDAARAAVEGAPRRARSDRARLSHDSPDRPPRGPGAAGQQLRPQRHLGTARHHRPGRLRGRRHAGGPGDDRPRVRRVRPDPPRLRLRAGDRPPPPARQHPEPGGAAAAGGHRGRGRGERRRPARPVRAGPDAARAGLLRLRVRRRGRGRAVRPLASRRRGRRRRARSCTCWGGAGAPGRPAGCGCRPATSRACGPASSMPPCTSPGTCPGSARTSPGRRSERMEDK